MGFDHFGFALGKGLSVCCIFGGDGRSDGSLFNPVSDIIIHHFAKSCNDISYPITDLLYDLNDPASDKSAAGTLLHTGCTDYDFVRINT